MQFKRLTTLAYSLGQRTPRFDAGGSVEHNTSTDASDCRGAVSSEGLHLLSSCISAVEVQTQLFQDNLATKNWGDDVVSKS